MCAKHHRSADLHLEIEAVELPISEVKLVKLMDELLDSAFKFSEVGQPVKIVARCVELSYQIDVLDMIHSIPERETLVRIALPL